MRVNHVEVEVLQLERSLLLKGLLTTIVQRADLTKGSQELSRAKVGMFSHELIRLCGRKDCHTRSILARKPLPQSLFHFLL